MLLWWWFLMTILIVQILGFFWIKLMVDCTIDYSTLHFVAGLYVKVTNPLHLLLPTTRCPLNWNLANSTVVAFSLAYPPPHLCRQQEISLASSKSVFFALGLEAEVLTCWSDEGKHLFPLTTTTKRTVNVCLFRTQLQLCYHDYSSNRGVDNFWEVGGGGGGGGLSL